MIRYKIVIRQLLRNASNSIIRIVSLVIGLTVSLLVFLQIAHQLSFDDFYPDKERMYRIGAIWNNKGEIDDGSIIIAPLAQAIKENLPEVEDFALIRKAWGSKFYTEKKQAITAKSLYADSTFFSFFHFPVIQRKTTHELSQPYRVLISQSTANNFFGDVDPLGKIIYDTNQKSYEVEGVFRDVPANSHLDFDIVISFETIRAEGKMYTGWGGGDSFNGYLKLIPGASIESVETQIPDVIAKYYDVTEDEKAGQTETFYLQKITGVNTVHDNYKMIVLGIMGTIGLIVLLVSVLNFVLLTFTSFQKQAYTLGVQQFTGASKFDIVKIIALEQFLLVLSATVICAVILKPMLVLTTNLWGWSDAILFNHYSVFFSLLIIGFVLFLAIGLPLIRLQGEKFKLVLTKKGVSKFEVLGKRILLSGQIAGVTVLMIVLFMLVKQLNFVENMQLGYNTNNLAYVELNGKQNREKVPVLLEQLQKMACVESASASSSLLIHGLGGNGLSLPGNKKDYWISRFLFVDDKFHETMGMNLTSGEYLSAFEETDRNIVIINKELAKMINWDDPVGQEFQSNFSKKNFRVVGVVEDFMQSARMRKLPAIFYKIQPEKLTHHTHYISIGLHPETSLGQINEINNLLKAESSMVPMELSFYDMKVAKYYDTERQLKKALMVFAILAMFLAIVGLGGFVLNEVQQKTKEIGMRKVNGATVAEVLIMLNRDYARWVILAFVIAFPLSYFAVEQGFQMYAYKTEMSWWVFALAGILAFGIALLTVSFQSWKVATRNPIEALRYE